MRREREILLHSKGCVVTTDVEDDVAKEFGGCGAEENPGRERIGPRFVRPPCDQA